MTTKELIGGGKSRIGPRRGMINRTVGAINCSLVVQLLIIQSTVFTEIHHLVLSRMSRDSENLVSASHMKSRDCKGRKLRRVVFSILSRMVALYPRLAMAMWRVDPTKHLTTSYVSNRDRSRSCPCLCAPPIDVSAKV